MKKLILISTWAKVLREVDRACCFSKVLTFLLAFILSQNILRAQDQPIIVFSESFDNASDAQPWSSNESFGWCWNSPDNVIESEAGRGKVLRINHETGLVGAQSGVGNYRIALDSAYRELYLSFEYFIPSDFDWGYDDGFGGGKFFAGFAGGSMTAIPNNDNTDVDGWVSMFIFQNGNYKAYNYFKNFDYDPNGWPSGPVVANLVKGQWHRITTRYRINDPNQVNGIYEVFDNDVLVFQDTHVEYVNSYHTDWLIEHIYLNNFWGGAGSAFQCPKDQYFKFDNLIAFYYPKNSSGYRIGASEAGRTVIPPTAGSYHPTSPNRFRELTYTDANGTIESHCGFYQPTAHPDGFQTATINISGVSQINMNVSKFSYDGGITYNGYKQILKVYQGIGSSKVLVKTFSKDAIQSPQSFTISGNTATIEWQSGAGLHNGFTLNYSSSGTSSGSNFECQQCIAEQTGSSTQLVLTPPSNLRSTSITTSSVNLSWNDNCSMENGYELQRLLSNGTLDRTFSLETNVTSFNDATVSSNTSYQYKVRGKNGNTYSSFSNVLSLTTLGNTVVNAPSNLKPTYVTATSIQLEWIDNSANETGFELQRLTAGGVVEQTFNLASGVINYTDNALTNGNSYQYRVRAVNASVASAYSNTISVVAGQALTVPAAPGDLAGNLVAVTSAHLQWTDNSGIEYGFELQRLKSNGTLDKTISLGQNIMQYTDNDLVQNTQYYYQVRAYNNVGNSVFSNQVGVKTGAIVQNKIVYINPSNDKDVLEDGSEEHPYSSWHSIEWKSGYQYLQMRGTVADEDDLLITADSVVIGSYGIGENPIISFSTENYGIKVYDHKNVTIENLFISAPDAIACVYFLGESSARNTVQNCILQDAEYCIRIVNGSDVTVKYNQLSSKSDALFIFSSEVTVTYNIFKDNLKAINVNDYSADVKAYNNVFYNNLSAISSSYGSIELYNNIFDLNRAGSVAISTNMDMIISDYNIFYPVKPGFIEIAGTQYDDISTYTTDNQADQNSKTSDPLFNNPDNDDYKVNDESPAIDAGKYLGIDADLYGMTVPYGNFPDIGVYENNTASALGLFDNDININEAIRLYPNPNRGQFYLDIKGVTIEKAEVLNNVGMVITELDNLNQSVNSVNLGDLIPGTYYIRILTEASQLIDKFIVQ